MRVFFVPGFRRKNRTHIHRYKGGRRPPPPRASVRPVAARSCRSALRATSSCPESPSRTRSSRSAWASRARAKRASPPRHLALLQPGHPGLLLRTSWEGGAHHVRVSVRGRMSYEYQYDPSARGAIERGFEPDGCSGVMCTVGCMAGYLSWIWLMGPWRGAAAGYVYLVSAFRAYAGQRLRISATIHIHTPRKESDILKAPS